MLEKDVLLEISQADQFIKNITVNTKIKGTKIGYSDICGRVGEKCFENPIIEILPEIDNIVQRKKKLKYPFDIDPLTYSSRIYSLNFGDVTEDENDFIQTANDMRLVYFTDESDKKKHNVIEKWRTEVYNRIRNHQFKYVLCFIDYNWSMEQRNVQLAENIKPMIGAVVAFISVFTTVTCMSNNWAKSKPFLGVASVVSAGLAVVTSFGFMSAVGVQNSIWNINIPFLVLMTGIDDAFVLLACWRISNPKHKIQKRMEETLGCMALSGYKEEKQQQAFRLDIHIENVSTEETSTNEPTMAYFRDKFGKILSMNVTKIAFIIVYFLNLSFGLWGALTIKDGIDFTKLHPQESVITQGVKIYYNSFGRYTFPYHIVINRTLDYSDLNVQKSVDELLNKFESLPYIAHSRFRVSWLKYYKEFQNHSLAKYSLRGYNMSVKEDFLDGLRNVFLKFKSAEQFSDDIAFNSDGSDILSSRFHVLVNDTLSQAAEIEMLTTLWKIADEFNFPVLVHAAVAPLYEQGIIIGRTIQDLFWITSLLVMILFIVFIPNTAVAVLVAISVTSTIVET
ncbi:uncharacterized protein LOC111629541 [Centruroides sculpturatus]|uniref:uncharacterized protein LOC111629541 n=1 Tax=Centruroides sculpturatus TaxID=218467 RepID=UPI000C6DC109|nr:uncharacterized protein LOC111629541 [Centruroides sculpturatus]